MSESAGHSISKPDAETAKPWPDFALLVSALNAFDQQAVRTLTRGGASQPLIFAVLACLAAHRLGHASVDLADANQLLDIAGYRFPPADIWLVLLEADARVQQLSGSGREKIVPATVLVRYQDRLYLARIWRVVVGFVAQTQQLLVQANPSALGPNNTPIQMAVQALQQGRLLLIDGGPGTGKTTFAAGLAVALAMALTQNGARMPQVVLAAPTGRAAARLQQAWRSGLLATDAPEIGSQSVRDALKSAPASTLHRLLGLARLLIQKPAGQTKAQVIAADVVIVDEASMVSLDLMQQLVSRLLPTARVVLLGDAAQLAAIEVGTPFADLLACLDQFQAGAPPARITLHKQWRATSLLHTTAASIRANQIADALQALAPMQVIPARQGSARDALEGVLSSWIQDGLFDAIFHADDAAQALHAAQQTRILCLVRHGVTGQLAVNAFLERALCARHGVRVWQGQYAGRVLIATRNNYDQGVMNGDVGIVWPDAQGTLRVYFDVDGQPLPFAIADLPGVEAALAMTVHKAQGSEFDTVYLILPDLPGLHGVNRALIYTALTRAKTRFQYFGSNVVLAQALANDEAIASVPLALWQAMENSDHA
jgi:exodeoxyribonuclease V alpha subunit